MIPRRKFLQSLALAAAAPTLAAPEPFKLRYILSSAMYGEMPLDVILPEAAKAGCDAVDIWCKVHGNQREQITEMGDDAFAALLKKNGTPTDTDFDFISRLNGRTNQVNLQLPEFSTGSFGLRVRTPSTSATQTFSVVLTTNRTDLRSGGYPALKPHVFTTTGTLTNNLVNGTWHYFQVDVPTNLLGWRIVLSTNSGSVANPDLFVQRGQLPTSRVSSRAVRIRRSIRSR